MIKKVVLFSQSALKLGALKDAVLQHFGPDCIVETLKPGETGCPQPISEKSAVQCIEKRMLPHKALVEAGDSSVLFVAIENYLEFNGAKYYYDKVVVMLFSQGGNWCRKSSPLESHSVRAPDAYTPHLRVKSEMLNGIFGCEETLGEMMHADNPNCPSDDWFQFSPYWDTFMSRRTQIITVLNLHLERVEYILSIKRKMPFYMDFPKPGVEFADVLPLMGKPSNGLPTLMSETINSCALSPHRFLVGLESRGLLLASMLSAHSEKMPFVACRKKGKLPRDTHFPINSITYGTEYSTDTLEIQSRHITDEMRESSCILIDDVLATGGSICAAANLLDQVGINVSVVLVLCDVPTLRPVWKKAFANNKNLAAVPVRFVL